MNIFSLRTESSDTIYMSVSLRPNKTASSLLSFGQKINIGRLNSHSFSVDGQQVFEKHRNVLYSSGSPLRCWREADLSSAAELNSDQLAVSSGPPPSEDSDSVKDNWLKSQLKLSRSLISAGVLHGATPGSLHFEELLSVFSSLFYLLLSICHQVIPPSPSLLLLTLAIDLILSRSFFLFATSFSLFAHVGFLQVYFQHLFLWF